MFADSHLDPSPRESRVERRRRETRDRIYRAALDLFVRQGLDDTTVAEIAEAADIGKGTFFTYFPTKESVFAEVSARLVDSMDAALDRAHARSGLNSRVQAFFEPAIAWHASNPVLSRFMLGALLRDAAFAAADRPAQHRRYDRLGQLLHEARAAGRIAVDVDLGAAVTAISGTYFGALGAWHGAGTATPLAHDFARSLAIVLRGLRR